MKKRILLLGLCLCTTCALSGCSVFSRKPATSDVTSFAKTCINESVEPAEGKYSEGDSYGKNYYYPMIDDHGIEFNVIAENEKVTLVEAYIPFLYSKNLFYTTDYKERIMAYYTSEIEDILKEAGIVDYKFHTGWIEISITEDYSLEDLATVIIALNDLLDYDYRNNTISRDSLGNNQYWDSIDWYDILIKQRGSDNKWLLYETFLFSDNNQISFTHENVLKTLELSQMLTTSDDKLNIIRINGELYYDSGIVTQDEKTGEMDGTAHSYTDPVPKTDDQTNFGSGNVDYQFAPDGTLYVFLSDGRHVFLKY